MATLPTIAPSAHEVFSEMDGLDFDSPQEFAAAYEIVVRRLGPDLPRVFVSSEAVDWALGSGVIQRDGDRVIIRVASANQIRS